MLNSQTQKLMAQEQKFFGLNPGFKQFSPFPFAGMNQQSSRQGMEDNEFFLRENYVKVGLGDLRTLWDQGTALYTAPAGLTIVYFFFFNIGPTNYVAIFLSDGTAIQVNTSTGVNTAISSSVGTFYSNATSSQLPICGQWGSTYLLIANNISANNYWVWDGVLLHFSGTLSPLITLTASGSGYTSSPTITAFGGSGSGATFTSTVLNGSVVNIALNNPGTGYQPGDVVQLYITGGGGDSSAQLTAVLSSGSVKSVIITNAGTGYTAGTYALGFTGGGGSGAAGTYTVDATQTVVSTIITVGGTGYTSTPTISFPSGGGSNAAGIALLTPGSVSSVTVVHGGTNFPGTPTLTFVGGGGSGATATAVMSGGVISSVTVVSGGSGYTSVPAILVQTGQNTAAAANVTLMPFGVSGSAIETFQQRVWLTYPFQSATGNGVQQNGGIENTSAPGFFTDFSTSDGGVQFINTDSFLRAQYVNIKQSNGYLYTLADSSISVISNVQTSGNPLRTTFNYQNTDPQTGTSWRDSVQAYSRTILFANPFGVFGLYGGAVTKISSKMDKIFTNMIFPQSGGVTPSSAVANIFNLKAYMVNLTILDPITKARRTVMVGWDEREWFVLSQRSSFTFIGTQEVNSNMFAWGTDGSALYPLFTTASSTLTKRLSTKLYGQNNFLTQKESMGIYVQAQDLSTNAQGIAFSAISVDAEHGTYPIPSIPHFPSTPPPYYATLSMGSGDVTGANLGITLTSTSPDFSLTYLGLGYIEVSSLAMSSSEIHGQINTE